MSFGISETPHQLLTLPRMWCLDQELRGRIETGYGFYGGLDRGHHAEGERVRDEIYSLGPYCSWKSPVTIKLTICIVYISHQIFSKMD